MSANGSVDLVALRELTERQRIVWELYRDEKLTIEQTAERLGQSVQNVESLRRRILQKCKASSMDQIYQAHCLSAVTLMAAEDAGKDIDDAKTIVKIAKRIETRATGRLSKLKINSMSLFAFGVLFVAILSPAARSVSLMYPAGTVSFQGHKYYLSKEPASLPVAIQSCDQLGGSLLQVETDEERLFVAELLEPYRPHQNCWLGMTRSRSGVYVWLDGTPVRNFAWRPESLEHVGSYDHVFISRKSPEGLWSFDSNPYPKHLWICEWK